MPALKSRLSSLFLIALWLELAIRIWYPGGRRIGRVSRTVTGGTNRMAVSPSEVTDFGATQGQPDTLWRHARICHGGRTKFADLPITVSEGQEIVKR